MQRRLYYDQLNEAKSFVASQIPSIPSIAIILGTGLDGFVASLVDTTIIPFDTIPNFPRSTAPGHAGELIVGTHGSQRLICLNGRVHYYEGYNMLETTFAMRLLGSLAIETVIITNAAGGTREDLIGGDIAFIHDHINLFPENPLRGPNIDEWGERFPDMSAVYSKRGLAIGKMVCEELNIPYKSGIYVGLQGPNLETPAEYQFVHRIGGDMVGMSTVPEVIVARHMGIEVIGISLVTNACYPPERIVETTLQDVINMAKSKEATFQSLISGLLKHL